MTNESLEQKWKQASFEWIKTVAIYQENKISTQSAMLFGYRAALIGKSFKAWRDGISLSDHDEATKAHMREYCESCIGGATAQFKVAGIDLVIK